MTKRGTKNDERRTRPIARLGVQRSAIHRSTFIVPRSLSAFTLTEILVVISIIILLIAVAVPALRLITGSNSTAGAANVISAFLGRARSEAIGLQEVRGVAFYINPTTARTEMAEVKAAPFTSWQTGSNYKVGDYVIDPAGTYFACKNTINNSTANPSSDATNFVQCDQYAIELVADVDVEAFPTGVGIQLLEDYGTAPQTDRYVATGAILFDSLGKIVAQPISIAAAGNLAYVLNYGSNYPKFSAGVTYPRALNSSIGFVLVEKESFNNQSPNPATGITDPTFDNAGGTYTTGSPSEQSEETWLDTNTSPYLVNRYTGTLIKSE